MALNDFSASIDQKLSDIADLPGSLDNESPSVLPYLEVSKPYSLDSIVKAKAAAKELNRPEPLVLDTLPDSLMEIQARRIENNQLFAGWASQSARNAAIAREDYEKLTPVFDSITNWNMTR